MPTIGYSTGSLNWADVRESLRMLEPHGTTAVELSALRTAELGPLLDSLDTLPLRGYAHVSVHAPGAFTPWEEPRIAEALLSVKRRGWLVVLHPDTIHDPAVWAPFGDRLALENMDRRKRGRTVEELQASFDVLPMASFCFDVAHARQCDTSMVEAYRLLTAFGGRLAQVHVSELNKDYRHVRLSHTGIWACQEIAALIPPHVPVIIEAPVQEDEIGAELDASLEALGRLPAVARAA